MIHDRLGEEVDLVLDALERGFGQGEELLADLGGERFFVAAALRTTVVVIFIYFFLKTNSPSAFCSNF
jgi:hypothetical protein